MYHSATNTLLYVFLASVAFLFILGDIHKPNPSIPSITAFSLASLSFGLLFLIRGIAFILSIFSRDSGNGK